MTPFEIGKSVIQTDCHINWSFLVQEGHFWDQQTVISSECHIIRGALYHLSGIFQFYHAHTSFRPVVRPLQG